MERREEERKLIRLLGKQTLVQLVVAGLLTLSLPGLTAGVNNRSRSEFFKYNFLFFIANTYTKYSLKTVQIHGEKKKEIHKEIMESSVQFLDIWRKK